MRALTSMSVPWRSDVRVGWPRHPAPCTGARTFVPPASGQMGRLLHLAVCPAAGSGAVPRASMPLPTTVADGRGGGTDVRRAAQQRARHGRAAGRPRRRTRWRRTRTGRRRGRPLGAALGGGARRPGDRDGRPLPGGGRGDRRRRSPGAATGRRGRRRRLVRRPVRRQLGPDVAGPRVAAPAAAAGRPARDVAAVPGARTVPGAPGATGGEPAGSRRAHVGRRPARRDDAGGRRAHPGPGQRAA